MVTSAASPALQKKAIRYFEKNELPKELEWVQYLTPVHQRLFTLDLKAALDEPPRERGKRLREVLESWEATASVDADEDARKALREPRGKKRYTDWSPDKNRRTK